jgi:ABC-type nickel/cobalt efflux system permease component RcnA
MAFAKFERFKGDCRMNKSKLIVAMLVVLIVGVGLWTTWKTVYHTDVDGHEHIQSTTHEDAISQMLGWLGSFYGLKPTVHDPKHDNKTQNKSGKADTPKN